MCQPIRRALSIGAIVVALGGLTATTATVAHAATATPSAVTGCHTDPNAYEVKDQSGNYVQAIDSMYAGSDFVGYLVVELWYCPSYQSNFARGEFVGYGADPQLSEPVVLTVRGQSGNSKSSPVVGLYPNVYSGTGSQDSPAYYAPVERAQACVYPLGPPYFTSPTSSAEDGVCTGFV
jgi:hypothetical protein